MGIYKIKGTIQNYAWGGNTFIPDLIGGLEKEGFFAEYWMGAHDKSPSVIISDGIKLNEFINRNPKEILGEKVNNQFGRLPFLFKVLDVKDMLSIQVHPSKVEAEKGFTKENREGIPINASHRNYKDDNHKPEIMVALGDFWLLHGFKARNKIKMTLQATPELEHLLPIVKSKGYQGLYQYVMEESAEQTNRTLVPLIDRLLPEFNLGKFGKETPEYWAVKAFKTFCSVGNIDKGIYSIFFFNIVRLKEGEGIFQDAGVPHAYMEGQNIELMANSDNVLRGGLTPKHVDVSELLKHVKFEETIPNVLHGDALGNAGCVYKSPAPDFELSKLELTEGKDFQSISDSLEIGLILQGEALLSSSNETIGLARGDAYMVSANTDYGLETQSECLIYKASCPED